LSASVYGQEESLLSGGEALQGLLEGRRHAVSRGQIKKLDAMHRKVTLRISDNVKILS
jgi:hypothetical protein